MHWVDDQGRVIASPLNPNSSPAEMRCFTATGDDAGVLTPNVYDASMLLGVRAGVSTYTILQPSTGLVLRASCGGTLTSLGTVSLTGAYTYANLARTVPMGPAGEIYFGVSGGIARLTLTPTPTLSLWATTAELEAATGVTLASQSSTGYRLAALKALPDDSVVALISTVPQSRMSMLRRSTAGAWALLQGDPHVGASPVGLGYLADTAAMVVTGVGGGVVGQGVAYFPLTAGVVPADRQSPQAWAPATDIKGLITGADGGLYAWRPSGLFPLHYDATEADFDFDGLRASEEQTLGLSDVDSDADRDGYSDGQEVTLFHTDPMSATSHPALPLPDAETVWAPSVLAASSYKVGSPGCVTGASDHRLCSSGSSTTCQAMAPLNCFTPDLMPTPTGLHAPDGTPLPASLNRITATPLSSTVIFQPHRTSGTDSRAQLLRVNADGSDFAVIDMSRLRCPVLPTAAALSDCENPKYRWPAITAQSEVWALTYDPTLQRVLAIVSGPSGTLEFALGATDALYVGDIRLGLRSMPPTRALTLPGGGYLLQTEVSGSLMGTVMTDALMRPVRSRQQFLYRPPTGFFRKGFMGPQFANFMIEPLPTGQAKCGSVGEGGLIFVCDFAPPQLPHYVTFAYDQEIVPVGPALEKGEVLMWSAHRIYPYVTGVVDADTMTQSAQPYRDVGWLLWRVSPEGGAAEWLTAPQFTALLSTGDRARLDTSPLGDIGHIGVSADGLQICLAEPAAQRIWQLSLNAQTRRLESAAFAGAGTACAFDDANALVRANGAQLERAAGSIMLPAGTKANQVVRQAGTWLVREAGKPLLCVADDGTAKVTSVSLMTLAPAFGGIAWVAESGEAFVGVVSEVCGANQARARLSGAGQSVFTVLEGPYTFRSVQPYTGALAVRPDGMAVIGAELVRLAGAAPAVPELFPLLAFHLFPTYEPLEGQQPMPGTETFRLEEPVANALSIGPGQIAAAAVIPGADPARSWGYFPSRPGRAPLVKPTDAGTTASTDGGTTVMMPPTEPRPCGCTTSPVSALALTAALRLRRRRSRS